MFEIMLVVKFDFPDFHKNKRICLLYELKSKMTTLLWHRRNFIPCPAIEITTSSLRCTASPLFMEKSNIRSLAAVAEITHPLGIARTMPKSTLSSCNQPVDSIKT